MHSGTRFNETTYDAAKPYLKAALEHIIAAGHSFKELAELATAQFGSSFYPYLREFQQDIQAGKVKVQGLTLSAQAFTFGEPISSEERERRIREAAYLRAERRGFMGGSPEEDWAAAEAEIDEGLAREAGFLEPSNQALESAKSTTEKEFASIRDMLGNWLESGQEEGKVLPEGQAVQTPPSTAQAPVDEKPERAVTAEPKAATTKSAAPAKPRSSPAKRAAAAASKPAPSREKSSGPAAPEPAAQQASPSDADKSAVATTKGSRKKSVAADEKKAAPGRKPSTQSTTRAASKTRRTGSKKLS